VVTTRTSPLKRFPASLKLRPTKELSEHERREAFRALLEHYKLKTDAINGLRRKTFERAQAEALLFAKLAKFLARDFVPAYWPASRRGRRKKADVVGGSFGALLAALAGSDHLTRVYQAQLVELVNRIKDKKQESQAWVFDWLTKSKNRIYLPALYRDLTKPNSLKQAFKKIPKPIRDDPTAYLSPASPSPTAAIKTVRGLLS
jgi:hypothetical protein